LARFYSKVFLAQLKAELEIMKEKGMDDPKDDRWCGYVEALGGSKRARPALCAQRKTGARGLPMEGAGLLSLRNLKVQPLE
jgi:hypothetical protein